MIFQAIQKYVIAPLALPPRALRFPIFGHVARDPTHPCDVLACVQDWHTTDVKPADSGIGATVADLLFERDTFAHRTSQILTYDRSIAWFDSIKSRFHGDGSSLRILTDQVVKVFRKNPCCAL